MAVRLDTEVLIVGAGPTGLVMATELLRRGVTCRIIDSQVKPSNTSRALAIHARTLELFDINGIIEPFLEIGWRSKAFNVYHRKIHIVRMSLESNDTRYPFVLCLPQDQTESILTEHLATNGGAVEWGAELLSFKQDSDQVISRLARSNGTEESISSRWLVGCDGAHSTVRHLLNQSFDGASYPEHYVLADVDFETSLDPSEHYLFSGGRGRVAGFHAFSASKARLFANLGSQNVSPPGPDELQALLDERGPGDLKITKVNWVSMHRIQRRQVHSYRSGRVFLAGDAAHVHSPTSGQGMNLGIQDAYNLAWKLSAVERKLAADVLLDTYGDERHLVGKQTLVMSDFFTRINEVRSPVFRMITTTIGPVLARQENIRRRYRRAVSGIATNYRCASGISCDHESNGFAKPGERMPDINVVDSYGESTRLFELMRDSKYQLLLFGDEHSEIAEVISARYGNLVHTHENIRTDAVVARSSCYLIRPDGYVAFRSFPASLGSLLEYLECLSS